MKLFVSSLEPSSNIHLGEIFKLIDAHASLKANLQIYGIYDSKFATQYSFINTPIFKLEDFSVMGFVDVFKKILFFKKAIKIARDHALLSDKILLLDSSSFHIPLGQMIKKRKKDAYLIYYILPQIWAWKEYRKKYLLDTFSLLCGILPFESEFYQSHKMRFVGHPLLDEIKELKQKVIQKDTISSFAFMPGSRASEIRALMPHFIQVAKYLKRAEPDSKLILVLPIFFKSYSKDKIDSIYGDIDIFSIEYDANAALYQSKFAFVCSGTATLQASLIGTPLILAYSTRYLEYSILKRLVKLNFIGIANIFYNAIYSKSPKVGTKILHPELIQHDLNATNLIQTYQNYDFDRFFKNSLELRSYLQGGSAKNMLNILFS